MTMAESAVEDAAAAPPGPAKPPPPSCTNNNTLAATANRNHHRASRKRRRLNQVLDDLNAHKSLPSEHETSLATTRLEVTSLASEEEEEQQSTMVFGSPRTASEHAVQAITKRLKAERLEGSTDEEVPPGNLPYQTYYTHNQNHRGFRVEESEPDTSQRNNRENRIASLDHQRIHHPHSYHNHHHHHHPHHNHHHHHHNHQQPPHQQASYHQQRATQKYRNCPCPNWVSQPLSAVLLPSPKSPLTPPTALTPLTPVSLTPLTPVSSPSSYSFEQYFNTKYMPEVGRKRSHSDSDVAGRDQRSSVSSISTCSQRTPRGSSLESEPTCSPQDSPLDLSMKNLTLVHNSVNSTNNNNNNNNNSSHSNYNTNPTTTTTTANNRPSALQLLPSAHVTRGSVSVPVVRGDVASPTTKESVASRYNLEVSPVVEEMPPGADVAYVCPVCGQMFSLHDRLAKHMASRHRRQGTRDASAKAYRCEVCKRSFARSDMLTRHMRLHTGLKPYTCKVCNQVFSRSDHLSTHQRTHTGEKPYKCPQCVYAACRRDMITRHLRTHAKSNDGPVAKVETTNSAITSGGHPTGSESNPSYGLDPIPPGVVKME